ncbi:hypothetical protein HOC80_05065 [archaeon]|nr:hypothetical protein [archaeon]
MKVELLKEKETPLLKRKRANFMVDFAGATPSGVLLREFLGKQLKVDKNLIAIRHIYQRYGLPRAKVIVHVYKDFETLKKLEQLSKKALEEYVPKEAPKAEEKPAEVKKEEAPKAEVKVEEKPVEVKKEEKGEAKAETPKKTEEKPVEAKKDGKEESKK